MANIFRRNLKWLYVIVFFFFIEILTPTCIHKWYNWPSLYETLFFVIVLGLQGPVY